MRYARVHESGKNFLRRVRLDGESGACIITSIQKRRTSDDLASLTAR